MKLKVKYLENAKRMKKISKGNWIDCYAYEDKFVPQGERAMINLGFALELPSGWEGHLAPRSSTFKTWGVIQTNGVGIVDDTYIGNGDIWHLPVYCLKGKETKYSKMDSKIMFGEEANKFYESDSNLKGTWIRKGDKVAQFRIMEVMPEIEFEEVESLDNEDRGGFGSSGTK